ncbi:MAG: hypothetical protein NC911_01265 [Candidatus Omnitrophica bacterium]|nr:hypothetical protein [Candidatus Omnitrophota bacterium]
MRTRYKLLLVLLGGLIFFSCQISAMNISGRVVELNTSNFQTVPVPGATVKFLGTNIQAVSDNQGNFTLTGVPANSYGISLRSTKTNYVPTYMMPMGYGSQDITDAEIMIFSNDLHTQFLHRSGAPSHVNGKGDIVGRVGDEEAVSGVVISARYADDNTEIPSTVIRYFSDLMMPVTGSTGNNGIFCIYNVEPDRPIKIIGTKAGSAFSSPLVVGYANSITVCGLQTVSSLLTVNGKTIWDDNPVGGVTVSVPGTTIQTTSDQNGNFTLTNISPFSAYFLKAAKTNYKDTYYLGFVDEETKNGDEGNAEVGIVPVDEYNQVMAAIGQSHTSGKGDVAGNVGMDGVVVKIYDKEGNQVNKPVYYFSEDGLPDPSLTESTADGGFILVNLDPGLYYLRPERSGIEFPVVVFNIFRNGISFVEDMEIAVPRFYKYSEVAWQVLPPEILPNANNVEMLRFNLWRNWESENVVVNSITFTAKGTGSIANSVSQARLYGGSSQNAGQWETFLGQGTISGNKIIFSNLSLTIWETGNPAKMVYLVFDFNGTASPGETFGVDLLTNTDIQAVGQQTGTPAVGEGNPVIGKITTVAAPQPPAQPINQSPVNGTIGVNPTNYWLVASNFDPAGGNQSFIQSQWQIWKEGESSQMPAFDEEVGPVNSIWQPVPLESNTTYYWRVRYKNGDNLWSSWSQETSFTTSENGIQPPGKPVNQLPEDDASEIGLTPLLQASQFIPGSSVSHIASHWQIREATKGYQQTIFDSGRDTVNLTEIRLPSGYLQYNRTYYWHVRYQDSFGAWSAWSEETSFTTVGYQKGDINRDTYINIQDVILCLRMATGRSEVDLQVADLNEDNVVNIIDVIMLLRLILGLPWRPV